MFELCLLRRIQIATAVRVIFLIQLYIIKNKPTATVKLPSFYKLLAVNQLPMSNYHHGYHLAGSMLSLFIKLMISLLSQLSDITSSTSFGLALA